MSWSWKSGDANIRAELGSISTLAVSPVTVALTHPLPSTAFNPCTTFVAFTLAVGTTLSMVLMGVSWECSAHAPCTCPLPLPRPDGAAAVVELVLLVGRPVEVLVR